MANEKTPLIQNSGNVVPPSNSSGHAPTVYFVERQNSNVASSSRALEATTASNSVSGGWFSFFSNVRKKSDAFAGTSSGAVSSLLTTRNAPTKVDPKVFFANERTFLAWTHVAVLLAGASVAITAFADSNAAFSQMYGVILLPISIAFIIYAMMQYTRRASMIRRKAPGPWLDVSGPIFLGYCLMLSLAAQFAIKLYSLM